LSGAIHFKDLSFLVATVSTSALEERGMPGIMKTSGPAIRVNTPICFSVTRPYVWWQAAIGAESAPAFLRWDVDLPGRVRFV